VWRHHAEAARSEQGGLAHVVDIVLGKYFASGPVKFDVGPYCLNGPAQIDCSNEFPITKLI
jgi:hypothetical protein